MYSTIIMLCKRFLWNLNILLYFMNNLYLYLERVNNNNVNIYILYTWDFHAQNNIVFILL